MAFSPGPRRRPTDQYWGPSRRRHGNSVAFNPHLADIPSGGPVVPPVTPQQANEFMTGGLRRRSRSRNPFRSILRRRQGDVMMSGVPQGYPHTDNAYNVAFTGVIPPPNQNHSNFPATHQRLPTQANGGPGHTPFTFATRLSSPQQATPVRQFGAPLGSPWNAWQGQQPSPQPAHALTQPEPCGGSGAPPATALPAAYGEYSPYHASVALGTPKNTPFRAVPELPYEAPSLQQWDFPSGVMVWRPHPAPHPSIPASKFWGNSSILQGVPPTPHQVSNTLLGQDASWTPGNCPTNLWGGAAMPVLLNPLLIPNPVNPEMPHLVWDISQNPSGTRRITGAHTIISAQPQLKEQATAPNTPDIYIVLQGLIFQQLWGPIKISKQTTVTAWDVLSAVYDYFQTPLTHTEVEFLGGLHSDNYDRLVDAWKARCNVTPALPGFEARQGLKRVDLLGDKRCWWGCWVEIDQTNGSWYLNLGLVNLRPGR